MSMPSTVLDLLAVAGGPAIGLGAGLACIAMAWRAAGRALPAGGDARTQRQAFALIAASAVAFAIALPLAIALLPRDALASVVVTLSGGFAWMIALQAMRLRAVARDAGLAVPAVAGLATRAPGVAERWTGLGATLLGLGLAMAGALAGGLLAALG